MNMPPRKRFRHKPPHPAAAARPPGPTGGNYWIFGHHTVTAALANPRRRIHRLLAAQGEQAELPPGRPPGLALERSDAQALAALLPSGAVHQGLAALVEPLPMVDLGEVIEDLPPETPAHILVLDQVTDPQNVGAILRSAAAFGAACLVLTERHAAPESGALAKAASGALDVLPMVRVVNLARAIEALKRAGFWCLGLAGEGEMTLAEAKATGRVALVLGAEGSGLRRLTREHCDQLVRLPTRGPIDQLNVSNAAAVALYELVRQTTKQSPSP
jgi:23S rRNA (guanosine2251-2'-O)-methyltransferase